MVRIHDVKLNLDDKEEVIKKKIAKKLKVPIDYIVRYNLFKEAVDARNKEDIRLVCGYDVELTKEEVYLKKFPNMKSPDNKYQYVECGELPLTYAPIVVGTGPCGLFAGLILAQMGYNPIIIERGKHIDARVKDVENFWTTGNFNPNSNVQFGEGGAGTFSDGKLVTQIKNKRGTKVLEEFVRAGAPEEILYNNKPHIGTDILRDVVKNIRLEIEKLGGEFRFETCLTNIKEENGKLVAIEVNNCEWINAEVCVLALGHSARDTFSMLHTSNVEIAQKPFAMGMRIEHLQEWIDEAQYGEFKDHPNLRPADYKAVHHCDNGRTVYSFCMCPGGYVVASASEENAIVTNGMSEFKRDGKNANSGILVNVKPEDFGSENPLAGVELQRNLEKLAYKLGGENYNAPVQTVGDFLNNKETTKIGIVKPTYKPDVKGANLRANLPTEIGNSIAEAIEVFGKKIKNFDHKEAIFTGFETRSSSPIRIFRESKTFESNISGLYPAGEGAGYAGGITSAGVDGIMVAEAIAKKYCNN
ncbi:MAG: hypothetical protein ATN36_09045 [Epulopiscium sp. Nele67-Bin005]|nr:MAG: hypothetical protein ATN36_09045 [Epulopiscium sp. Nele67-Bin005]